MDTKDLKKLVERYWQGETSLEEEASLRQWFRNNPTPEGMEREASLFAFYSKESELELPKTFDEDLLEAIDQQHAATTSAPKVIPMWSKMINWKVAAVISGIIVASLVLKNPFVSSTQMTDTYDNPQDAYEATKAILLTISTSMNKGRKYTEPLSKFSETQEKVAGLGSSATDEGS